jgi:hypothetical protein
VAFLLGSSVDCREAPGLPFFQVCPCVGQHPHLEFMPAAAVLPRPRPASQTKPAASRQQSATAHSTRLASGGFACRERRLESKRSQGHLQGPPPRLLAALIDTTDPANR